MGQQQARGKFEEEGLLQCEHQCRLRAHLPHTTALSVPWIVTLINKSRLKAAHGGDILQNDWITTNIKLKRGPAFDRNKSN